MASAPCFSPSGQRLKGCRAKNETRLHGGGIIGGYPLQTLPKVFSSSFYMLDNFYNFVG